MKTKAVLLAFFLCSALISVGQWYTTYLSQPKACLRSATLGSKVYIAGGYNVTNSVTEVEIYDVVNEDWDETIHLSVARALISCIANGSSVFFAGGIDFFSMYCYSEVDIWNTLSQQWDVEYLSVPRFDISAVTYGNKVYFAGGADMALGICYNNIDIYDTETGLWSADTLPLARAAMGATIIGDLAIYAGGYDFLNVTDRVDMYNFTTGTWSTATLSEARGWCSALTIGNKVVIAGGMNSNNLTSDVVDIYDVSTGDWSTATLSAPRAIAQCFAAVVCDKAWFVGGGTYDFNVQLWTGTSDAIDIYDGFIWTTDNLNEGLTNHAVSGAGNHLVVAGGNMSIPPNWYIVSYVDIYVDPDCWNVGIQPDPEDNTLFKISPNPVTCTAIFEFHLEHPEMVEISVINSIGEEVYQLVCNGQKGNNQVNRDTGILPSGVYVCKLVAGNKTASVKMIIVH
jgi:hypothetical protein